MPHRGVFLLGCVGLCFLCSQMLLLIHKYTILGSLCVYNHSLSTHYYCNLARPARDALTLGLLFEVYLMQIWFRERWCLPMGAYISSDPVKRVSQDHIDSSSKNHPKTGESPSHVVSATMKIMFSFWMLNLRPKDGVFVQVILYAIQSSLNWKNMFLLYALSLY